MKVLLDQGLSLGCIVKRIPEPKIRTAMLDLLKQYQDARLSVADQMLAEADMMQLFGLINDMIFKFSRARKMRLDLPVTMASHLKINHNKPVALSERIAKSIEDLNLAQGYIVIESTAVDDILTAISVYEEITAAYAFAGQGEDYPQRKQIQVLRSIKESFSQHKKEIDRENNARQSCFSWIEKIRAHLINMEKITGLNAMMDEKTHPAKTYGQGYDQIHEKLHVLICRLLINPLNLSTIAEELEKLESSLAKRLNDPLLKTTEAKAQTENTVLAARNGASTRSMWLPAYVKTIGSETRQGVMNELTTNMISTKRRF